MFGTEHQWKQAERNNWAMAAVGICIILVDLIWDPMPTGALRGAGVGMLSAAFTMYLILYRRKGEKLAPDEQRAIIEREQRVIRVCSGALRRWL